MIFIGIDPGIAGAVAIMLNEATISITDCPATTVEMSTILYPFRGATNVRVALEEVPKVINRRATPSEQKRGIKFVMVPATELRMNYGEWRGILTAHRIPFETVPPKKWQSILDGAKKKGTKFRAFDMAQRLYPNAELKGPRGGVKYGRSDALTMAEWLKRQYKAIDL